MFENVELKFPVDWHFHIICDAQVDVTDGLVSVLREFGVMSLPKVANKSSGGKYCSYVVSVTFHDSSTMNLMASRFGTVPGVKRVI